MKANIELRYKILESGLSQKEISAEMGISPSYLAKILRHPVTPYQNARIISAIDRLSLDANRPTTRRKSRR